MFQCLILKSSEKLIDDIKGSKSSSICFWSEIQHCMCNNVSVLFQLGKLAQKQLDIVDVVVVVKAPAVRKNRVTCLLPTALMSVGETSTKRVAARHTLQRGELSPPSTPPPVCTALIIHFHSNAFQESKERQYTTQPGEKIKIWLRLALC